jgi:6-phosphogluconolactonase
LPPTAGLGRTQISKPVRKVLIKNNLDELGDAAAGLFVAIAIESIAMRGKFSVALAGGATPRALYSLLGSDKYKKKVNWSKVTFFFGDERNVPADADDSNYRMANETLLAPLGINAKKVHRWKTELEPTESAADYETRLRANGPLDLVLLGLGSDAHTASLFPQTKALNEKEKLAVANWVEKLDDHRLTLTFPAINAAQDVMFLVSGKEKADAVAGVLEGESRPDDLPAQRVKPTSGNLFWLFDVAAASGLKGP